MTTIPPQYRYYIIYSTLYGMPVAIDVVRESPITSKDDIDAIAERIRAGEDDDIAILDWKRYEDPADIQLALREEVDALNVTVDILQNNLNRCGEKNNTYQQVIIDALTLHQTPESVVEYLVNYAATDKALHSDVFGPEPYRQINDLLSNVVYDPTRWENIGDVNRGKILQYLDMRALRGKTFTDDNWPPIFIGALGDLIKSTEEAVKYVERIEEEAQLYNRLSHTEWRNIRKHADVHKETDGS